MPRARSNFASVLVTGNAVGNTPSGGVPQGGGIFNGTGTLVIVDSTISGNTNSIGPGGGGVPEGVGSTTPAAP